jgi:hypothetical protein
LRLCAGGGMLRQQTFKHKRTQLDSTYSQNLVWLVTRGTAVQMPQVVVPEPCSDEDQPNWEKNIEKREVQSTTETLCVAKL